MIGHECRYDWHEFCEEKGCSCVCHPAPDPMREALRQARPKWYNRFLWWMGQKDM